MATKKQKEQLMATLKFTPRDYRIEITGYGGEIYFGQVDRKIYEFFKEHKIDIAEYIEDIYKYDRFVTEIKEVLKKSKVDIVRDKVDLDSKSAIWNLKVKK